MVAVIEKPSLLQRAAPLMLTALCVAIPARAGLVVIGAEGALVLGGLACASLPYVLVLPQNVLVEDSRAENAADAGLYVALVGEGRYAEALGVAAEHNPFPSVCGRVCTAPCESPVCRA